MTIFEKKANEIIKENFKKIFSYLNNRKFIAYKSLPALFTKYFIKDKIVFMIEEDLGKQRFFKYFNGAMITENNNIIVFFSSITWKYILKNIMYLKKEYLNIKNNPLSRELSIHLSHELVHKSQMTKSNYKILYMSENDGFEYYLGDKGEIMARAHDVYMEKSLPGNSSPTITLYEEVLGRNSKEFKRLMKQYYKFKNEKEILDV
jgi:hypothetical protein